tara:strand:- start:21 stop:284 length:264 start_codon:yes stop_codon:yes gene_type:complete
MEHINFFPFCNEIKQRILTYMQNKEAFILINAHFVNKLVLTHVPKHKTKKYIWHDLRPSILESNVYGTGMYIVRTKISIVEGLLLFN